MRYSPRAFFVYCLDSMERTGSMPQIRRQLRTGETDYP